MPSRRRHLTSGALPHPWRLSCGAWPKPTEEARANRPRPVPTSLTLLQRPPGAIAEGQFLAACTRCGDCIEVCPPRAIVKAPEAAGNRAGTPMIDALRSPCVMCDDLPCIDACEPGVLRQGPAGEDGIHASVDESLLPVMAGTGMQTHASTTARSMARLSMVDGDG